jgi:hypothetical protein
MYPLMKYGQVYQLKKLLKDKFLKMKIAVCVYGLPRGNSNTWSSLVNAVCKPLEADLFIHTWMLKEDILTHTGIPQPKRQEALKLSAFFFQHFERTKSVIIDYQQQHTPKTITKPWGIVYWSNQINMFLSLLRVSKTCKEFGEYDAVVFTRSDIYFQEQISLQTIKDAADGMAHGGIKQKDVGVDFDDVFFIIKNRDPSDTFLSILEGYFSNYYQYNDVYNIIPSRCTDLSMVVSNLNYKYGASFFIHRSYSIRRIMAAVLRRLKAFIQRI